MQDNKTNRVFFSACLTEGYRSCAKAIKDALRENGIVVEKKSATPRIFGLVIICQYRLVKTSSCGTRTAPIIFGKSRATDNILQAMLNVIFLQVRK